LKTEDEYLAKLYQRFPINIAAGKAAKVWDTSGKEYIDCMGGYGVALVGHSNDKIIKAIKDQAEKIIACHMSVYNDTRLNFLEKLAGIAPEGLSKTFFSNSGAEAVEAALKFSRKYSGKTGIIAMSGAYHGKTFGALSVTYNEKYRKSFMPLLENIKFVPYNDPNKLEETIDNNTGTIILEPIQGETGIIVPRDGLLQEIRRICNQYNLVLIFDEIQTGLGRTGRMWAGENWNTVPDIMCIAKGIAGGVPMGLTLAKPEIMQVMTIGDHSSTFAGNPLACAAAAATLDVISEDKLIDNALITGKYFKEGLLALGDKHKIIREVRGLGMMLAVELRFDIKDLLFEGIKNGLLMLYSGRNIIRLLPPLVMDEKIVSETLKIMDQLLTEEEKRRNVK
jgi:LysW-gamma-L-lysine/LysW-L-ornithine aminotransferase